MALRKYLPSSDATSFNMAPLKFSSKVHEKAQFAESGTVAGPPVEADVDIDLSEVYFLIMHFLSAGPCHRTYGQFWNELLEHQLLPRRYHAWYSRSGIHSGDESDNGISFPLSYTKLVERYPHIEKDHLVKLLKKLILTSASPLHGMIGGNAPNAADVPTLLGSGSFSLLEDKSREDKLIIRPPTYLRWPHMQADQVRGLSLREIGGGFTKHHRAPSIRAACYAIAKPSTMVQKMQNIKKLRGHRDAVYCATFDRSGRYVITGSDDRLVKIWSMETAFCLASCRGHEGDITDLAVSSNNSMVASASNDFTIRVWRLPDGAPISVLRGHTGAVTAIAFSPRAGSMFHLLSSSDDGTCRIWDARYSQSSLRIYLPKPPDAVVGKSNGPSSSNGPQNHQILCCAYNANGTVFVTGSSDTYARVWNACKSGTEDSEQPIHEMDVLSGHENDVNYVQFSGCAVASRSSPTDSSKEENVPRFKNSWFTHDNIVTCSRDGSAIIWIPRSRRSHGKVGRWTRAYHLKVPPPPMPPQPARGGPRQRYLPTPRGVNMIVWSLDNRFVLAAIMDCRICVWNAGDGSLVHSLTGHSESTYVLDVHPFNPRIAMSAGYDGRTIVWDIWEGTPIRVYETGRFKLVDGKFSPDGTSIVLSDDVGQIYILNTGQGEAQKDAKYDQFFLGDYRPLVQDTHGNVLDQETQLAPYRRNILDLLCDSSMIPYPEPYQSMYQQRRLGALGIEWRPSSVKLAVGPVDINGFLDYQILPLPDLDRIIEPIPEFIDAMDWEPDNEIQSDDNDSEYNVTDEYSSEGEEGSLSNGSAGDPECSIRDSDVEEGHNDSKRRSKRKKHRSDVEIMTSSGRRVKRRNLDERDGTLSQCSRPRKPRNGHKALRKKSSTKSLRPQRVAARNALNLFSRINGTTTDEEEDDESETDSSESESSMLDSTIQSNESDRSMQNVQLRNLREREALHNESEGPVKPFELPESRPHTASRTRLVLKLPIRDPKKIASLGNTGPEKNKQFVSPSSSKMHRESTEINRSHLSSQDPGSSSGHMAGASLSQRFALPADRVEDQLELSAGYKNTKFEWGEVKLRSSKRMRSGDSLSIDAHLHDDSNHGGNHVNGHLKAGREKEIISYKSEIENFGDEAGRNVNGNEEPLIDCILENLDGANDKRLAPSEYNFGQSLQDDQPTFNEKDEGRSWANDANSAVALEGVEPDDVAFSAINNKLVDHSHEVKEIRPPLITKVRFRSKTIAKDLASHPNVTDDWKGSSCDSESQVPLNTEEKPISQVPQLDEWPSRHEADHEDWNDLGNPVALVDKDSALSTMEGSKNLRVDSNNKMYNAVYKRSKSKARTNSEGDSGGVEEHNSKNKGCNSDRTEEFPEASDDLTRRTRSMGLRSTTQDSKIMKHFDISESDDYDGLSVREEKSAMDSGERRLSQQGRLNSRTTVGLRSTRNRRGNYYDSDITLINKRPESSAKKLSWLLLSEHEESYRYIPQLGDEVAYLRQGHQEYIAWNHSTETGPWRSLKGSDLRAVEFCKVECLDYASVPSGESCCKMTLEFVDPSSSVFGKRFRLTLPELVNFSDFLVERTRYDAAIERNWTTRDKCLVWWRNENAEGGNWWEGRIIAVKPKSSDFPESPWERFSIRYKSDSESNHLHSPWELHDPGVSWEHPHIDGEKRAKLLSVFAKFIQSGNRNQDRYGIQKLGLLSSKKEFLNRFPVPVTFDLVYSRLENNYYRSLEAVEHDIKVMVENAQSYFRNGKNAEITTKMKRLSEYLNETLLSL